MKEYIVNLADISEYGRRMIIGNGIPKEELIRCKDCKHWFSGACFVDSFSEYDAFNYDRNADDYCSRAERKEE